MLNSAVVVESAKYSFFSRSQNFFNSDVVSFYHLCFINCYSSEFMAGGLSINNTAADIQASCLSFYNCRGISYGISGGMSVVSKSCVLNRSFYDECYTNGQRSTYQSITPENEKNYLFFSTMVRTGGHTNDAMRTFFQYTGDCITSNVNISYTEKVGGAFGPSGYTPSLTRVEFCHFEKCTGNSGLNIEGKMSNPVQSHYAINIINNTIHTHSIYSAFCSHEISHLVYYNSVPIRIELAGTTTLVLLDSFSNHPWPNTQRLTVDSSSSVENTYPALNELTVAKCESAYFTVGHREHSGFSALYIALHWSFLN